MTRSGARSSEQAGRADRARAGQPARPIATEQTRDGSGRPSRGYVLVLGAILLAGLLVRIGYVLSQPRHDPSFSWPILDGAYYLDWARSILTGASWDGSAFYMAPLYPYLLAGFLRLFGESFTLLYLLQHLAVVASAGVLAEFARRAADEKAALATAALVLLYHPLLFFASRPLGEPVPLLAISLALLLAHAEGSPMWAAAGVAAGVASLGRPNLLLVPALWAAAEVGRRRYLRAGALLLGTALAVSPVALRNHLVSGHLVPISANSGIVLYLGNGPGAVGGLTRIEGFSGGLANQRAEAVALARARSHADLDPVEADRWWGREALRERLRDPVGSLLLLGRRFLLTIDDAEHGLDYSPSIDPVPLRHAAPVHFAILLALSAAAIVLAGFRGSGGRLAWLAIASCAAAPLIFYASSRHRLPMAMLLAVPAGVGLSGFLGARGAIPRGKLLRAIVVGASCGVISLAVPSGGAKRSEEANALLGLAESASRAGDLAAAERMTARAVELDGGSAAVRFNRGAVLERAGRSREAEEEYRRALGIDPGFGEAAANLAGLLVKKGAAMEAVPILRRALAARPAHALCWTNLVVALRAAGDLAGARDAAEGAEREGVHLDGGLLRWIGVGPPQEAGRAR